MRIPDSIVALVQQRNFGEAILRLGELLATSKEDQELWFSYGVCLREANRQGEAIDAFLRCWVLTKQLRNDAASEAMALIRTANPEEGLHVEQSDTVAFAAMMFREQFEERLASLPPSSP
jgi:hypothetical protein